MHRSTAVATPSKVATKAKKNAIDTSDKESSCLPGTIYYKNNKIVIAHFKDLPPELKDQIKLILKNHSITLNEDSIVDGDLFVPQVGTSANNNTPIKMAPVLGKVFKNIQVGKKNQSLERESNIDTWEDLDFAQIQKQAQALATFLEENKDVIATSLSDYECYNVAIDEINRSIDLLVNLDKNRDYFQKRAGAVTTFLPINQPIYATVCFGVVPSYMAADTFVRVPTDMQEAFKKLDAVVNFSRFAPRLQISYEAREVVVEKRKTVTETVIFTGRPENAVILKKQFNPDVLFILNGSGHNPLVISDQANLQEAVKSTLQVCLQNQGQDCAAPNAILVKASQLNEFRELLLTELKKIGHRVGPYNNRDNIVGPNTRPDDVIKIATLLHKNRKYCLYGGNVNVVSGLIEPCVLEKPLKFGGNFEEFFAPIIMLQPYDNDADLAAYFEHPQYKPNAMYVTLFGESMYVESLVEKGLHTPENIVRNTDLHKTERGFLPYGGLGWAASSIHLRNNVIPGATLPQRDIYTYNIKNRKNLALETKPQTAASNSSMGLKLFDASGAAVNGHAMASAQSNRHAITAFVQS